MSLRRKLIYLLTTFAAFALLATFATVYGIQLRAEDAAHTFERSMDQARYVDDLRLAARALMSCLRDVSEGRRRADDAYLAERGAFFTRLDQLTRFAPDLAALPTRGEISIVGGAMKEAFDRIESLAQSGRLDEARATLERSVAGDLLPTLDARLQGARGLLEQARQRSVVGLVTTHTQILLLATVVGALGAGLVAAGAALIRRWLIQPIDALQRATRAYSAGRFEHRVALPPGDELGALGAALNAMAASLIQAEAELRCSEAKYRCLFANLRDALVICDPAGRVIEYHDGDLPLLGAAHAICWSCGRIGAAPPSTGRRCLNRRRPLGVRSASPTSC
jgi:HAMP domain-containing protein